MHTTMPDTITTTTDDPTEAIADDPNTSLKVRAWAFHCQGLASPAISQRLGTPERTVRHWIATITSELAADCKDQRATHLTLAIARKRHLSAAAWDGYERALAIEASQRTRTPTVHDANDDSATRVADQTARHALAVAARFLRLVITIDRDLAALESAFDQDCAERERQEWEDQREQEREQQRAELARERMLRDQDRLDRAKEREREPRPPRGQDPATVERIRFLEPRDRSPEINAYFAAYDTYHAARQAAERYARDLDGSLDPYDAGDTETDSATYQRHDFETERHPRATLPALSQADIAALTARLTARLDAEEAATNMSAD